MRLRRRITALLAERNIITGPQLEQSLQELEEHCKLRGNPKAAKWVKTTLRKWLINDYDDTRNVLKVRRLPDDSPGWAQKALERGEELWSVMLSQDTKERFKHVLDWLMQADVRDVTRVSVPEALKQTKLWDEELKKQSAAGNVGKTETVMKLVDGMSLVKLLDKEACEWEGAHMGHCIASYDPSHYENGYPKAGLYSIRDRKGLPHVTMEVVNKEIVQIKGKENDLPVAKYMPAVSQAVADYFRGRSISEYGLFKIEGGGVATISSLKKGDKTMGCISASRHGAGISDVVIPSNVEANSIDLSWFTSVELMPGIKTSKSAIVHGGNVTMRNVSAGEMVSIANHRTATLEGVTAATKIKFWSPGTGCVTKLKRCTAPVLDYPGTTRGDSIEIESCSFKKGVISADALSIDKSTFDELTIIDSRELILEPGLKTKHLKISRGLNNMSRRTTTLAGSAEDVTVRSYVIDEADFSKMTKIRALTFKMCKSTGGWLKLGKVGELTFDNTIDNGNSMRIESGIIDTLRVVKYGSSPPKGFIRIAKGVKIKKIEAPDGVVQFE